jgi:hypothetical protein
MTVFTRRRTTFIIDIRIIVTAMFAFHNSTSLLNWFQPVIDLVELPDEFIVSLFVGVNCHVGDDVEALVVAVVDEDGLEDSSVLIEAIVTDGEEVTGLIVRVITGCDGIPDIFSLNLSHERIAGHAGRFIAEVVSDEFARHCVIPPWQLS